MLTPEVLVLARMIMVLVFGYSLVYAGLFFFYQVRGDWGISMVPVAAAGFTKIVVGFVALHAYWVLHVISALPALVGIIDIILGVLYLSFVFRGKK